MDYIFMCKLYKPCLKDVAHEIPLYLEYLFTRRRALYVLPYLSLCKTKCPLVGPILGGFYLYAQVYKPCLKDVAYEISLYLDY